MVHDHPEPDPSCTEARIDGRLVGACILGRRPAMVLSEHGPRLSDGPAIQGVATVDEWRFDVVGLLLSLLKGPIGLRSLEQGIDSRRLVGQAEDGTFVSITLKPVGPANSGKFQKWVTLSPTEADGLVPGPRGWRGLVAMIGLLDSGQPWWIGVYDREDLRATAHQAEQVTSRGGGWFYRWDPGILKPIIWRDLLAPDDEVTEDDLPRRVVVGKNGAYWRSYENVDGTVGHYSMPPVSTDNDPVEPIAVYERVK